MGLSDSEIQSLRSHLGYGALNSALANNYTPDGFYEMFNVIVAPSLQTAATTTASTAVVAGTVTSVTVASLTDIAANTALVVDVADDAEVVVVRSTGVLTFSARFAKDHAAGYPVAVMSGEARLRMLLWSADTVWRKAQASSITSTAGLKSLGQNEIVWKDDGTALSETMAHYRSIVLQIADLVRVRPAWESDGRSGRNTCLSAY